MSKFPLDFKFATLAARPFPLRWHFVLLVTGCLMPVVLFAVVVVHRLSSQEQVASERRVLLAAQNLAGAVDREVASTIGTLQAMATSEQLDQGNLKNFYSEASRVVQTQPTWLTVILLTPDGRQLINTNQPFGRSLPSASETDSLKRVVKTLQPTVGDLVRGHSQTLAFPIRVPVVRDGHLRYILTAVITPEALTSIVKAQFTVDGEWTRTIVDGQGIVVARTRNPDRFVGKRGTPSFLKRIGETTEGVYRDTTLEGVRVYVAFSRLDDLRWTAAVTVPVKVIQGPSRQAMETVVGSGAVLLLVSCLGAVMLSQRISRSIISASEAAAALAKGEAPHMIPSSIQEINLLGAALTESATLLLKRQQQRDEHLAQAEAARAEAETANRLKDEFLITISHELRTPLNAILGWASLLRTGRLPQEKEEWALETIERNAKAQARMVDDLLDTSRIITGKLRFEKQPVNLTSVIQGAADSVRHAAEVKGIQLKLHLAETGSVLADYNRMQQVMWNLLSNAIKFTPRGGRVEASLRTVDSQAEIQVSDTGIGISAEFLPYVFDRFRQSDGSMTREYGGLGLGLAIVRHLIELQGGTVRVDSAGEGQGATFTVCLPLLNAPDPAIHGVTPSSGESRLPSLSAVRILLVEDDTDTRALISFILTEAGAIVTTAPSAIEALDLFLKIKVDALVSDIGLPGMDGYQLIRQIRTLSTGTDTLLPALALTAYAGEVDQQQAFAAGFQMHLAKPIEAQALVQAVATLVGR